MSICLCNLSADTALELAAHRQLELTPASPDASAFTADPICAAEILGDLAHDLPRPLELLVGGAKRRRVADGLTSHVWKGTLPKNSVLSLGEGLYVTSPELTLLQQAGQLHQANLCQMLGRYLGTWSPVAKEDEPYERAPLVQLDRLNSFLRDLDSVRGKGNLRFAMAHTCEGAASAQETSLQLALALPPELHGMGVAPPTMNYKVDLSRKAQRLCSKESIRIDLCWREQRFGIEYQGTMHGNQLGEDYARWFAAREEGYDLWFVAKEQLESAVQMSHIGREVAKRIGHSIDEATWPTERELQDLLDVLAGRKHAGPVGYNELRARQTAVRSRRRGGR